MTICPDAKVSLCFRASLFPTSHSIGQMTFKKFLLNSCVTALAILVSTPAWAQALPQPQDTSNAIGSYEVLGVRLGMSEADAIAAVKTRFPAGSKNANGQPVNLRVTDYELTSPRTNARVRAGVRIDLHPEAKNNFDFIKIFVFSGKVWAVWRDDSSGRYDYDKMLSDLVAKYPGASRQQTQFMIVNGGTIAREPGPPAVSGVELFQGQCIGLPFARSGNSDKISLGGTCRKVFDVGYQPQLREGVKVLASGRSQLVDLDAGRAFMSWMSSGAGNVYGDKPKTTDAKL